LAAVLLLLCCNTVVVMPIRPKMSATQQPGKTSGQKFKHIAINTTNNFQSCS